MAELRHSDAWLSVWVGDCRDALAMMPERSIQAVVTSPPFYGLRDYGTAEWEGGDSDCDHTRVASGRGTNIPQTKNPNVDYPIAPHRGGNPNECVRCGAVRFEPTIWGGDREHEHIWGEPIIRTRSAGGERDYGSSDGGVGRGPAVEMPSSNMCVCGSWRGALGLEPTPAMYIDHLVEVFREVRRVLRDDGILWLNLGDSYANDTKWGGSTSGKHASDLHGQTSIGRERQYTGLKSKDLIGIPWMAAFALRADGWYLRSEVTWVKPNAMPSSTKDRPTSSHESIFMLTKKSHYYFDMEAVKDPVGEAMIAAAKRKATEPGRTYQHDESTRFGKTSPNRVWSDPEAVQRLLSGRHMRDVMTVATRPYKGAHYAVFPPDLVTPLIKAATSEKGCCAECGAPFERLVDRVPTGDGSRLGEGRVAATGGVISRGTANSTLGATDSQVALRMEYGWRQTCEHGERYEEEFVDVPRAVVEADGMFADEAESDGLRDDPPVAQPVARLRYVLPPSVPCVVLDPFGGSGTVGLVAQQLGRRAVLVDLNPEYSDQQMVRNKDVPLGL